MATKQLMLPANRAFSSNGLAVPGAVAKLYATGTLEPALFYADAALTTSLGPSITANGAGRFAPAYQDETIPFRFRLEDSDGAELDDIDPFYFGYLEGATGPQGQTGPQGPDASGVLAQLSASTGASLLGYLASGAGAVSRMVQSKLRDVVSVKDFGAVGDGAADDTAPMAAAMAVAATGVPIFVPRGTYMVDPGTLTLTSGADRFVMYGEGSTSIIKIKDGTVNADYKTMFNFVPTASMELIEVRDLFLDHNARGSAAPAGPFDYQHSHTITIALDNGVNVKVARFSGTTIKDPAADGWNIGRAGTYIDNASTGRVRLFQNINCAVIDRTRVRTDIQFSSMPVNYEITGFSGTIEHEPNQGVGEKTRGVISNCILDKLDLDANLADQANGNIEVLLDNVVSLRTLLATVKLKATNCTLTFQAQDSGRINYLAKGSRFHGCTFRHEYTAGTPGSIVSLWPHWAAGYDYDLTFTDCDFEIDSTDQTISPTGAMIYPQDTANAADIGTQRLTLENCRFDPRCEYSVRAYRCGTVKLKHNVYGGKVAAIYYGVTSGKGIDLTVDGGDYSRVTGGAIAGLWSTADQSATIAYLRMRGEWTGLGTIYVNVSGAPSSNSNQILSNRRLVLSALPSAGLLGDIVELSQPTAGAADSYRCTASAAAGATWKARTTLAA